MKTQKLISAGLSTALVLTLYPGSAARAKKNNNDLPNGKPFQVLNQLIDENRSMIEANQGAISELEIETDAINTRIDSVEANLADVATQVAANSDDISNAFTRIASGEEGDIETLRSDLDALAAQHQADVSAMQATLASIQNQINDLVTQSAALATELNDRVAELRGLIDNNAVGIDALVLDISLLNTQVGTINSNILALSNQQDNLSNQVEKQKDQLANLDTALDELKDRVNAYQPCTELISFGQTVTGELTGELKNAGCISDSDSRGGGPAQYYTFTIAKESTVTIEMNGECSGVGTLHDPKLFLHAGGRGGPKIAEHDDYGVPGCRYEPRMTQPLFPGTYTVEADSYGDDAGTFQLSVY